MTKQAMRAPSSLPVHAVKATRMDDTQTIARIAADADYYRAAIAATAGVYNAVFYQNLYDAYTSGRMSFPELIYAIPTISKNDPRFLMELLDKLLADEDLPINYRVRLIGIKATMLGRAGKYEEAIELCDRQIGESSKADPDFLCSLVSEAGDLCRKAGKINQSVLYYQNARMLLDPPASETYNNFGAASYMMALGLYQQGKKQEASQLIDDSLQKLNAECSWCPELKALKTRIGK